MSAAGRYTFLVTAEFPARSRVNPSLGYKNLQLTTRERGPSCRCGAGVSSRPAW